jgi:hypothetical protein
MQFFALKDQIGHFEQVFAVSSDDRAVKWNYNKSSWLPLPPSFKLARQVIGDPGWSVNRRVKRGQVAA